MRRLGLVIYIGLFMFLVPAGCQETGKTDNQTYPVFQNKKDFARALAGTWRAEGSFWEIDFAPDGTISSAVIPLGNVRIRPNQTTEVKGWLGEPGIFQAGSCPVYLEPQSRQISIQIPIEKVYARFATASLDGTCQYFIEGEMAKNNQALFATAFTVLKLDVIANEPNSATGQSAGEKLGVLDTNPNQPEEAAAQLIFTRVER